jgi:hypothetical protein
LALEDGGVIVPDMEVSTRVHVVSGVEDCIHTMFEPYGENVAVLRPRRGGGTKE